jgi:hypothetical protein
MCSRPSSRGSGACSSGAGWATTTRARVLPTCGRRKRRCWPGSRRHPCQHDFDLHAGVRVSAHDRERLERVCRYALRPPVAQDRLQLTAEGQVLVRLKHRSSDGTTHLLFDPLELLERLAVLTPRPRINLILYHGLLPFGFAQGTPSKVEGWRSPQPDRVDRTGVCDSAHPAPSQACPSRSKTTSTRTWPPSTGARDRRDGPSSEIAVRPAQGHPEPRHAMGAGTPEVRPFGVRARARRAPGASGSANGGPNGLDRSIAAAIISPVHGPRPARAGYDQRGFC